MYVLKICQVCDRILGELEMEDLTAELPDSIIRMSGNVAYALCPDCVQQIEVLPLNRLH